VAMTCAFVKEDWSLRELGRARPCGTRLLLAGNWNVVPRQSGKQSSYRPVGACAPRSPSARRRSRAKAAKWGLTSARPNRGLTSARYIRHRLPARPARREDDRNYRPR